MGALPLDDQLSWLSKLLKIADDDAPTDVNCKAAKAGIALGSANQILQIGICSLEAGDHRLGLKCAYEAQQPLEVGRQVCTAACLCM